MLYDLDVFLSCCVMQLYFEKCFLRYKDYHYYLNVLWLLTGRERRGSQDEGKSQVGGIWRSTM